MRKTLFLFVAGLFLSLASFAVGPVTGTLHVCVGGTSTLSDTTSGGHWSSSSTAIATIGSSTGIVTGVTAGSVTVTYEVGTAISVATFVVNPLPAAITGGSTETVGATITLADATTGGGWVSGGTSIATVTSAGVVTGVAAGVVNIYYELTTGCTVYHTDTVTGSTTVHAITGTMHTCTGAYSILIDSTSGGIWSSSNTAIATVTSGGAVVGVSAGTVTISYTVSGTTVTTSFTVIAAPAAITGAGTEAVGATITLSDATTGGYWSSGGTSIATVGSTGIVTGVAAGVVNIYYNMTTGCSVYHTDTVTGGTSVLPITGTLSVCVGSTVTLADATTGGYWTSGSTSIATVASTSGVVTGVAAGTVTISYHSTAGIATATVTVNPVPAAITGSTTVAVGATITMSDATSGGHWADGVSTIATIGSATGIITGVGIGTTGVYYILPTGCGAYTSVTVTSGSTTIHAITGTMHTCTGAYSILIDSTSGGTWSSSNTAIATVTTGGAVIGVSAGTVTISYTVSSTTVTTSFTVYAAPAAITGPGTEAVGSTITLSDATTGGYWSSGGTSIATVGSTGIVTGVAAGVVNIYYNMTTGCSVYHTDTVTSGTTTVHAITGTLSVCVGSTVTLADATTGGYWTSGSTSIATVASTSGVVTGIAAGTVTISYHSSAGTATATITVNPVPAAITGSTTVAVGGTITMSDATSGGHWADGVSTIATIGSATGIITGVGIGTTGVYYILPTGCGAYTSITVTSGSTTVHAITGTMHTCTGAYSILIDSTSGGTWSSSNTAIATVTTGGAVIGVSAGTVTISYTVSGTTVTTSFTVYAAPAAITGAGTEAVGSTITLSDATTGGYWSSGGTSIATVGSTGIVTGVAAGVVNIYYNMTTGCSVYHTDTVTSGTTTVHAITGTLSVCVGSTVTLADATTGGYWTSSSTSIATVASTSGVVTGVAAGTVTISYHSTAGTATATVTVDRSPAAITGSSTVCSGASLTMTDATSGGYWVSSSTSVATVGSATGIVTTIGSGVVNIYYIAGGCGTYKTLSVTATPSLTATSASVSCSASFELTATGATYYSWSPSTGLSCTSCSSTEATITSSVTYTVTGYNGTTCYSHVTVTPDMNRIYGYATFSGATPDSLGMKVWLIKYNPSDSSLTAMDSTYTCLISSGTPWFMFHDEPAGSYLVKGRMLVETPGASGYVPTYSASTTHWYSATAITHSSGSDYAHITMIYGTVPAGPGFISGYISAGAGRGTSGDAPVAGMLVYLEDMSGTVLTQTYTDGTGAYSFPGIANGSYQVYPENYGFYTTTSSVTLSATDENITGVDFKQHTTSGTITPFTPTAVSTVVTQDFNIYPNPTTGNIFIEWANKTNGNADVTISDVTGRIVGVSAISLNAASGQSQLNVSNLNNGIYLISIKGESVNYNGKIMVQH